MPSPINKPADDPTAPGGAAVNAIERLIAIVRQLRGPGGCPWDREQTLDSLKPFLLEETYEVLDALASGSAEHHREELGDLLLQILLQAEIRSEQGAFALHDVADGLAAKLVRRHPHVFGEVKVANAGEVLRNWETIKKSEKKKDAGSGSLAGIPVSMPALLRAQNLQRRAARVGFDWPDVEGVVAKIREELAETEAAMQSDDRAASQAEVGDLLFAVVNLARFLGFDAEQALDATNRKFIRRFEALEARVVASGRRLADCSLADMDAIWESVKAEERRQAGA